MPGDRRRGPVRRSARQARPGFIPAAVDRAAPRLRYADLDTAFLYRKELVDGATCNGRDHFGLARIDAKTDPTLRPGDIVATESGLLAVTGMKNRVADFTPIDSRSEHAENSPE